MKYLLDTNVLSEPAKPAPNVRVLRQWRENADRICTAAPVWNELLFGCYRLPVSRRRERFEHYVREILEPSLLILPYDARAAEWHAAERARLGGSGRTPSFRDGLIAAVAGSQDLILVTRNVRDFEDYEGLAIEDWASRGARHISGGRARRVLRSGRL